MLVGKTNGFLQEHLWWLSLLGGLSYRDAHLNGRLEGMLGPGMNIMEQPWVTGWTPVLCNPYCPVTTFETCTHGLTKGQKCSKPGRTLLQQ